MVNKTTKFRDSSSSRFEVEVGGFYHSRPKTRCKKPTRNRAKVWIHIYESQVSKGFYEKFIQDFSFQTLFTSFINFYVKLTIPAIQYFSKEKSFSLNFLLTQT